MFSSFRTSSHARHWMFASEAEVDAKRQATHAAAIDKVAQASNEAGAAANTSETAPEPPPPPVPREDGELLCARYELKLQELCDDENTRDPTRFTKKVLCTAQTYLKRFYLHVSPMEEDPKGVMLAALYLAGKVEEERIQVTDLVPKYAKLQPHALLALELRLMEALRFQLVVRSPFRCLTGLLHALHGHVTERAGAGGATAETNAEIERLHRGSIDHVKRTLRTNSIFIHSPQQIALAALLSAASHADLKTSAIDVRGWIETRFGSDGEGGGAAKSEGSAPLLEQLARVQQASSSPELDGEVSNERLKAIDSQLRKVWKLMKRVEKEKEEQKAKEEHERFASRKPSEAEAANTLRVKAELEKLEGEARAAAAALTAADAAGTRKRRRGDDASDDKGSVVKKEAP